MKENNEIQMVPLDELPLSHDFMFTRTMTREKNCKLFLEALLGKEIEKITFVDREYELDSAFESHGVRLDVYLRDADNTHYNIEMQNASSDEIMKRARYYHSSIDRHTLAAGLRYDQLPKVCVIFVCNFDYFREGLAVYKAKTVLEDTRFYNYDDGAVTYYLNSQYRKENASDAILDFLSLVRNKPRRKMESELASSVLSTMNEIRSDTEARFTYMTTYLKITDMQRAAKKEGYEEGREEGREEGIRLTYARIIADLRTRDYKDKEIASLLGITIEEVQNMK